MLEGKMKMFRETQIEIDVAKKKLSEGNSRIENGKTLVEVGLSDLNKLLEIAYHHEKENYQLKHKLKGFLIWEEMYPSIKTYNNSHPALVDDDYEDYRKLVSESKEIIENSKDV